MEKKILALLLAVLVVVSLLSTMAFAAGVPYEKVEFTVEKTSITKDDLSDLENFDIGLSIKDHSDWLPHTMIGFFMFDEESALLCYYMTINSESMWMNFQTDDEEKMTSAPESFENVATVMLYLSNDSFDENSFSTETVVTVNDETLSYDDSLSPMAVGKGWCTGNSKDGFEVCFPLEPAGSEEPDPCTYTKPVKLTEGTFGLKLCGCDKGEFTFASYNGGWSIYNGTKFLAMQNGKLALSSAAFAWTYKNGAFSASVQTTQKTSGRRILFFYVPGTTKTVTTTYYLNRVNEGALSTCSVGAELYEEVTGVHSYEYVSKCNGTHDKICKNCKEVKNENCVYDQEGNKCVCGAYDPSKVIVKISVVDMKVKTEKQFSGFLFWGKWKNVTTYTATIKTEAVGVMITKVQYQVNCGKWMTGSSVCSDKPIEKMNIRALGSDGKWYTGEYPEVSAVCDIDPEEYPCVYKVVDIEEFEDYGESVICAVFMYDDGQWILDTEGTPIPKTVFDEMAGSVTKLGDCVHMNYDEATVLCQCPEAHDFDVATFTAVEGDKEAYYYCVPVGAAYSIEDGILTVETYGEDLTIGEAGYTWKLNGNDAPTSGTIEGGEAFVATFMTVGDVLANAQGFPTDAASDWVNGNNKKCYYQGTYLKFMDPELPSESISFSDTILVSPTEGGYVATDGDANIYLKTLKLNMSNDGKLQSIEITVSGLMGSLYSDYSGTYAPAAPAGTTVADVLATVDFEDYASGAYYWENGTNTLRLYTASGLLYVIDNGETNYDCVSTDGGVESEGSNYICSGSFGTFSFNMAGGSLESVTFTHSEGNEGYAGLDGTYSLIL